jgi:hypothetical protein
MATICETFVDAVLFNGGLHWGQNLLRALHEKGGSGFTNFVSLRKSDFEILLLKIGLGIQKKAKKYSEEISASIRIAIMLR